MTNEALHQSVERLRALSPKLNEATDKANEVVAAVVTFLNNDCSIGLPAFVVVYRHEEGDEHVEELVVSYERWNGQYQIVVTLTSWFVPVEEANTEVRKPWDQCPRDLKLQALQKLPELLHEIANKAEKLIGDTTTTTEVVGDMLGALRVPHIEITEPLPAHLRNLHLKPAERLTP